MFFTIYKITHIPSQKIYIGKHQTKDVNDDYFGSGKYLKHAVAKYGINSFKKEVLYCFDTEEEMNAKEKELVTEEFCKRKDTYNICVGGQGGFSHINRDVDFRRKKNQKAMMHSKLYGNLDQRRDEARLRNLQNPEWVAKNRQIRLAAVIKRTATHGSIGGVDQHSDQTKQLMSEVHKERLRLHPDSHSSFGTKWMNNGQQNKKVKKDLVDYYKNLGYNLGKINKSAFSKLMENLSDVTVERYLVQI